MDITDEGIEILENVEGVEIVVTSAPARISGVVTDDAGTLMPEAVVIIFPEARERRAGPHNRFVTTVRTGEDGRFQVHALPPASYFAIAVPHLQDGEWAEPERLERLEAQAVRFTVADGDSKTIALKI